MSNRIQKAFKQIHATGQMKSHTYSYILEETKRLSKHRHRAVMRPALAICAMLVLCFGTGFGGWYIWKAPVSYISIDINPSIEITLNRLNRVTKATGQNTDGKRLLEQLHLNGQNYIEAIETLLQSKQMQPYLTSDADLTVTVASPKAAALCSMLESSVVATYYHGRCVEADMETATHAHQNGMSFGKYQIYLQLIAYGCTITQEQCQEMPMCQLRTLLAQYENTDNSSCDSHTDNSSHNRRHHSSHE